MRLNTSRFSFNLKILKEIYKAKEKGQTATRQYVYQRIERVPLKRYSRSGKLGLKRVSYLHIETLDRHIDKLAQKGYVKIVGKRPKEYDLTMDGLLLLYYLLNIKKESDIMKSLCF